MGHQRGRHQRPARRRADEEERILPLINIVFLLLIFFMVVGRLSAAEPFEIEPTRSASPGAPANDPMMIAIGPNGELAVNGEIVDEDALFAQISDAEATPEIRIKSDARMEAAGLVSLLEKLRLAGVPSVRLMTVPTEGHVQQSRAQD